ncbi:MAG: diacylglycerol/lipid kinase family protein [Anaerovoracaceae bacterium]
MKHIFIINPVAGDKKAEAQVLPVILRTAKNMGIDYEIHRTLYKGGGERYVKNRCMGKEGAERIRFYAVGGDGTLNEVVNGAQGFANVEITVIPAGTGNDFIRTFGNTEKFHDVVRQIEGHAMPVDLLKCGERYGINMINIGLDCDIAVKASVFKEKPFLKGSLAYVAGAMYMLRSNKGIKLSVAIGNEDCIQDDYTLIAIGNGRYCGGGFKGVPGAYIDDGLLDIMLIKKVSRKTLLAFLGRYRKGTHLDCPAIQNMIRYVQSDGLVIVPKDEMMGLCIDGEFTLSGKVEISVEKDAIMFSTPRGVDIFSG